MGGKGTKSSVKGKKFGKDFLQYFETLFLTVLLT